MYVNTTFHHLRGSKVDHDQLLGGAWARVFEALQSILRVYQHAWQPPPNAGDGLPRSIYSVPVRRPRMSVRMNFND